MNRIDDHKTDNHLPDYRLDNQVGFVLRRAQQRHLAIFADHIGDLTPTQFATLAKLHERGETSQNRLGRLTAMDAATIKGVIDRLKKRALIETEPDSEDQRRLIVRLTEEGRKSYSNHVDAALAITLETLEPLAEKEKADFLRLLKKLT